MGVAQLVELLVVVQAVAGSSPVAHPSEGAANAAFLCLCPSAVTWSGHQSGIKFSRGAWRYPFGMALSPETLEAVERARARLAARTPEENRLAAQGIRELAKGLESERHRARSEEWARELEAMADAAQSSDSSPAA